MKYSVRLRYFEDDNANWGFTHANTFNADFPFDAFYTANGIMHDLYEHWFEGILKPFRGNNMCVIYGEMVASAMRIWMRYNAGFNIFSKERGYYGPPSFFEDTIDEMHSYLRIENGDRSNNFPVKSIPIPYQKPFDCYNLDTVITEYWYRLRERYGVPYLHHNGVKQSYIANAYRYGYKLAERLYGKFDRNELNHFFNKQLDFWYDFTQSNNAKALWIDGSDYGLRYIDFTLNTGNNKQHPVYKLKAVDDVHNEFPISAIVSF